MDQQLLQRTRYLLQTRFRRWRSAPPGNFAHVGAQVLNWLENHPVLGAVLQQLDNVEGDHQQEIEYLQSNDIESARYYYITVRGFERTENERIFKGYTPSNFEEHVSACLQVIRVAIRTTDPKVNYRLAVYLTQEEHSDYGEEYDPLEPIREIAVRDLYEYLDEQLDGINAVNGILQKYKQNVEWFQQERLQEIIDGGYGGNKGERALALHLQQYVFDQGVDFTVEPTSASGEADLVLRDPSGQFTIIDAKYIKQTASPSEITRKIADGFYQVARYCNDYNQPEGFLAVYVNDDISIQIDLEENAGFRFFRIGGRIIYYTELNISERPSASKSGKAKQVVVNRDKLIETIQEIQSEASA